MKRMIGRRNVPPTQPNQMNLADGTNQHKKDYITMVTLERFVIELKQQKAPDGLHFHPQLNKAVLLTDGKVETYDIVPEASECQTFAELFKLQGGAK